MNGGRFCNREGRRDGEIRVRVEKVGGELRYERASSQNVPVQEVPR
jgi:hypothetical protein